MILKRQGEIVSKFIIFLCVWWERVSKFKSIYYLQKIYMYFVVKWSAYTVYPFHPLWEIILAHGSLRVIFILHNTSDFECEKSDSICFIKYAAYVNSKIFHAIRIKYEVIICVILNFLFAFFFFFMGKLFIDFEVIPKTVFDCCFLSFSTLNGCSLS